MDCVQQNNIYNPKTFKILEHHSSLWAVKSKEYSFIHVCNQFYACAEHLVQLPNIHTHF